MIMDTVDLPRRRLGMAMLREFPDAGAPARQRDRRVSTVRQKGIGGLDDAAREVLRRISAHALTTADELNRLRRLLERASLWETAQYVDTGEMLLDAFKNVIRERDVADGADRLMDAIEMRIGTGVGFTPSERVDLAKLRKLLDERLPPSEGSTHSSTLCSHHDAGLCPTAKCPPQQKADCTHTS